MLNLRKNAVAIPGREARMPGSNERIVANNGELNANNRGELLKTLAHLLTEATAGNIDITNDRDAPTELTAAQRVEHVKAAYNDYKQSPVWAEMGTEIAADVNLTVAREGFMRRLLFRNDLVEGSRVAMIRTRVNNVTAVVLTTPSHVDPQFITSNWFTTPEFNIIVNVLVDGDEITMEGESLLQEQYDYALESFMVREDRAWKAAADAIVGTTIPLQVFANAFGPDDLINMMYTLSTNGVTPVNVVMHNDYWRYIINADTFSNWFDPASKYQLIQTGTIGTLLGLTFITDGYRQLNMQVIQPGEIYMVGAPEQHGGYTDRGPITAVPTEGYNNGLDARGWFMKERLSMAIVNPYSVVKGRKL